MSAVDESEEDRGGDGIVAAEYVLGTLPAAERAAAAARLEMDAPFAALVDAWEVRLAPLAAAYVPEEPPAAVKREIERRLFGGLSPVPLASERRRGGLWESLGFWRGLAGAALASLLVVAALPLLRPDAEPMMVASLAGEGSDVRFVAVLDREHEEVALAQMGGEPGAGRDFELWMIEGGAAPVSMGVIPAGDTIRIRVTSDLRRKMAAGAVLAISLEPAGGSPTGQPTGPVVATGDLRDI